MKTIVELKENTKNVKLPSPERFLYAISTAVKISIPQRSPSTLIGEGNTQNFLWQLELRFIRYNDLIEIIINFFYPEESYSSLIS